MSGIAGIWDFHSPVNPDSIKRMADAIAHRGVNESFWNSHDNKLSLGHRCLHDSSILNFAEHYTITFDGAIHNAVELHEQLKKKGYIFTTNTDSEVVLAAYHEYKEDCLSHFDGMFAFAIRDNQNETLFCARDRFGMKPFFYCCDKNSFRFSSEMKSLWADGVTKKKNDKMLFYYIAYQVVENPFDKSETFYKNIFRLEAAHSLLIRKDGSLVKKRYWDVDLSQKSDLSFKKASERFRELFFQSVHSRLRSENLVGASLSGGVDSSSVVAAAARWHNTVSPISTFTARFNDAALDEGKFVDEFESHTSIQRNDVWVNENVLLNDFDKILTHQEEPLLDSSPLAQWCVMKASKEKGISVLLDGQGADVVGSSTNLFYSFFNELFLTDKNKFRQELSAYKKLRGKDFPADLNFKLQANYPSLFRTLGNFRRRFSTPSYLSFLHPEFIHSFRNEPPPFRTFNSLNEDLKYTVTVYGLEKLLRYADRNASAYSCEVRFPFLSHELVEFVFSLPSSYKFRDGWTKYILRHSMQSFIPHSIAWQVEKLSYQPPWNKWFESHQVQERVNDSSGKLFSNHILRSNNSVTGKEWLILNATNLF